MKINLGCRNVLLDGFTNIDQCQLDFPTDKEFIQADVMGIDMFFEANTVSHIYSYMLFEHLTQYEITNLLYKLWVILKEEGTLEIIVPDYHYIINYYHAKHKSGDFSTIDILPIKIFDVPEETLHRTIWDEYIGKHFFEREGLFYVTEIIKNRFEITFKIIKN